MSSLAVRNFFVFGLITLAFYVMFPLLLPVGMGGIFAILLFPWLEAFERRKVPLKLGASLLLLGGTLLFVVPIVILLLSGAKAAIQQFKAIHDNPMFWGENAVENVLQASGARGLLDKLGRWLPLDLDALGQEAVKVGKDLGLRLADVLGGMVSHLPAATVSLVIMVISTYFFLVDGRRLEAYVRRHSLFDLRQTDHILRSFTGICRSVILATFVSGLAQSGIYTLMYIIVGGQNPALIGFLVLLASLIPLVGSAPLTFGVALWQLFTGDQTEGVVLLITAGIVSMVDNVVRPIVLRGSANLHPLLAFLAVFGGLQVMGFVGVFMGPIVVAMAVTVLQTVAENARK